MTWIMPEKKNVKRKKGEREKGKKPNTEIVQSHFHFFRSVQQPLNRTDGPSFKSCRLETELKLVLITVYIVSARAGVRGSTFIQLD